MTKEKQVIDLIELKEKVIKNATDKVISEVFIVRDDSRGRIIELQSGSLSMGDLSEIGWTSWNNFFKKDEGNGETTHPTGVS